MSDSKQDEAAAAHGIPDNSWPDNNWIDDPQDPDSWQNGLQRLSRSIVACALPEEKEQLKAELEQLLRQLFSADSPPMLEVALFIALGWRRFDLVNSFMHDTPAETVSAVLPGALLRLFSRYRIRNLDFTLFIEDSPAETVALLRKFLIEKKVSRTFEERLSGSFSGGEARVDRAIGAVHELVCLIGVAPEELELGLRAFLEDGHRRLQYALDGEDWPWAMTFLKRLDPLRHTIQQIEFSMESLFYRLYRLVPQERRAAVIGELIRWSYTATLRGILAEMSRGLDSGLLTGALMRAAGIPEEYREPAAQLIATFAEEDWRVIYQLVCYMGDVHSETGLLQEQLHSRLQSRDPAEQDSGFYAAALIAHLFEKPVNWLSHLEREYIEQFWEECRGISSAAEWSAALERLWQLRVRTGMEWLESELLLPLLKEGLCSYNDAVCAASIRFCRSRRTLAVWFAGLISDSFFQMDLTEGLYDQSWRTRIRSLNRLQSIFLRAPVQSLFLLKRLRQFEDILDEWAGADPQSRQLRYDRRLERQLREATARLQRRCAVTEQD